MTKRIEHSLGETPNNAFQQLQVEKVARGWNGKALTPAQRGEIATFQKYYKAWNAPDGPSDETRALEPEIQTFCEVILKRA